MNNTIQYAANDGDALTPQEKERLVQTMLARLNRQTATSKQVKSIHTLTSEIRKQISEIEGGPSCHQRHQ